MIDLFTKYITGGIAYTIPSVYALTYALTIFRFLLFSAIISYYFAVPYTVLTMILAVVLGDFRFFIDYNSFMAITFGNDDDEDEEENV